jgi:hypothetical protein
MPVVLNHFLASHILRMTTHLEYPNYKQTTVLHKQVTNCMYCMYQYLKVKVWNNLATHKKKPMTHKCVVTPWLRTTALCTSAENLFFVQLQNF